MGPIELKCFPGYSAVYFLTAFDICPQIIRTLPELALAAVTTLVGGCALRVKQKVFPSGFFVFLSVDLFIAEFLEPIRDNKGHPPPPVFFAAKLINLN